MSRWWAERIRLAIHPDRLVLAKIARGWRPTVTAHATIPHPEGTTGHWRPLLARLGEMLAAPPWRGVALEAVLSHQWCRLALLPAGIALRNRQEEMQFARLRLVHDNGDLPANWEIAISSGSPVAPRLACAVDSEVLSALDAAASQGKSRVVSVQPYLAAGFNEHRRAVGDRHVWFATLENQRLCLARVHRGRWQSVRVSRLFDDPGRALSHALDQEHLLGVIDNPPTEVVLCAPETPEFALPVGSRWQLSHLPTTSWLPDPACTLTLENSQ